MWNFCQEVLNPQVLVSGRLLYFKRKITETVKVTSIYGDYSLTNGRKFFFNVTCQFNDNSLSVTFVNNKAFECSIIYVRCDNSVRGIFRVICLWLDVSSPQIMEELIRGRVLIRMRVHSRSGGGVVLTRIGALINRLGHIWCGALIREGALIRIITVNIQMLWPFNFTLSSVQF